jgi:POT family proton-dependent oligopeptide transporter
MKKVSAGAPRQLGTSQPKALYILFFAELWERFSFYGMRALLVLYMTSELLFNDRKAYDVYGIYTALVYAAPVIGGYLADNYLGNRKAIYLGGVIITLGHCCLALPCRESLFYGLAFIIVGTGFFKANVTSLLGQFYEKGDVRRDAGFTLFYMGINLGACLAPLVCGYIGKTLGWHYGFGMASVGMILGMFVLLKGAQTLDSAGSPPPNFSLNKRLGFGLTPYRLIVIGSLLSVALFSLCLNFYHVMGHFLNTFGIIALIWVLGIAYRCNHEERKAILTLLVMLLFFMIFWAGFEQAGSSINLFTARHVDRYLFGWEIPVPWFQSIPPFFVITLAPLVSTIWVRLGKKNLEPLPPTKFGFGLLQGGIGFGCLLMGIKTADTQGMTSAIWLILAYFFHASGELNLSPVGLSMVTKLSPPRFVSFLMGILFLSVSFGNYLAALFARIFGAPEQPLQANDKLGSLICFSGTFEFLAYFLVGASVIIFFISPFMRKTFEKHL